jgi:hypothetical protein
MRSHAVQPRHSALAMINQPSGAVFVGTLVFEYADSVDGTQFYNTATTGIATAGFNSALRSGEIAIPAATAGQVMAVEVSLARYMTMRASAYTSGVAGGVLMRLMQGRILLPVRSARRSSRLHLGGFKR